MRKLAVRICEQGVAALAEALLETIRTFHQKAFRRCRRLTCKRALISLRSSIQEISR